MFKNNIERVTFLSSLSGKWKILSPRSYLDTLLLYKGKPDSMAWSRVEYKKLLQMATGMDTSDLQRQDC
jgi:hypothetical protein